MEEVWQDRKGRGEEEVGVIDTNYRLNQIEKEWVKTLKCVCEAITGTQYNVPIP